MSVPVDTPTLPELLVVGGRSVPLDADGHLARAADWRPAVGRALARRDGVELNSQQWAIVEVARAYYNEYHVAPGMRLIIQLAARRAATTWQNGRTRIDSRDLYRWFGETPARRICLYAGLPKPRSCI